VIKGWEVRYTKAKNEKGFPPNDEKEVLEDLKKRRVCLRRENAGPDPAEEKRAKKCCGEQDQGQTGVDLVKMESLG